MEERAALPEELGALDLGDQSLGALPETRVVGVTGCSIGAWLRVGVGKAGKTRPV
jgi:hypothetical protein